MFGWNGMNEKCLKCGGDGWVWCSELDQYDGLASDPHDCYYDDTKYICDECNGLGTIGEIDMPDRKTFAEMLGTSEQAEAIKQLEQENMRLKQELEIEKARQKQSIEQRIDDLERRMSKLETQAHYHPPTVFGMKEE